MWTAKNKDGSIFLYTSQPYKLKDGYYTDDGEMIRIDEGSLNMVVTDEPQEIVLLPHPTETSIFTNPIYKAIFNMGCEARKEYESNRAQWHDLKDKSIIFPASSFVVLVMNKNKNEWEHEKYSLIQVEKLLEVCDQPYCRWTHWMEIPYLSK